PPSSSAPGTPPPRPTPTGPAGTRRNRGGTSVPPPAPGTGARPSGRSCRRPWGRWSQTALLAVEGEVWGWETGLRWADAAMRWRHWLSTLAVNATSHRPPGPLRAWSQPVSGQRDTTLGVV